MNELNNSPGCERASDLIAFLYDEADEREARDFRLHLEQCDSCRTEAASFGAIRESITVWRDETLPSFVPVMVTPQTKTKSAMAALRQFFDLSPLWLKGATAFALFAFCLLAGLVVFRNNDVVPSPKDQRNAVYTEQDVERKVKEALARQDQSQPPNAPVSVVQNDPVKQPNRKPKSSRVSSPNQFATSRRPLSRAEREQLAADLRLLSSGDDAPLLVGDRINQ